jgi:hypothetical protein
MIELTGSTDFLLVLSNMYTSIVFNHTLNQEDLVKFKGFIEDSQEYANGNQSKSVQILIRRRRSFCCFGIASSGRTAKHW